ncbi:MAG: hypothetical protein GF350_04085 [Chitinivibrionales bacterium]|nr:hypothetical protein [Chitinivibrionales bacterium]
MTQPDESPELYLMACNTEGCSRQGEGIAYMFKYPPGTQFMPAKFQPQTSAAERARASAESGASGSNSRVPGQSQNPVAPQERSLEPESGRDPKSEEDQMVSRKNPAIQQQLGKHEIALYNAYAKVRPVTPDRIDYAVKVGHEMLPPRQGDTRGQIFDDDQRLLRIDVVEHYPDKILILEIKPVADLKALGQMLIYPELYSIHYKPNKPVAPMVICSSANPIVLGALKLHDVPFMPIVMQADLSLEGEGQPLEH